MAEVWFYHLERESMPNVLIKILNGMADRRIKTSVHFQTEKMRDSVSHDLWAFEDIAFAAHGVDGDPYPELQPHWLTVTKAVPNQAIYRFFVEGVLPSGMQGCERASILFDGNSEEAVQAARAYWKTCKAEGHAVKYWRQNETGRWEDQAAR